MEQIGQWKTGHVQTSGAASTPYSELNSSDILNTPQGFTKQIEDTMFHSSNFPSVRCNQIRVVGQTNINTTYASIESYVNKLNCTFTQLEYGKVFKQTLPYSKYNLVIQPNSVSGTFYDFMHLPKFVNVNNNSDFYKGGNATVRYSSKTYFSFIATTYNEKCYKGFIIYAKNQENTYNNVQMQLYKEEDLLSTIGNYETSEVYEDNNTFGKPSDTGGYGGGAFDDTSDTIGIPSKPSLGVSTAGFVNVYNIGTNDLVGLGNDLFSDVDINFEDFAEVDPDAGALEKIAMAVINVAKNFVLFGKMAIASIKNMFSSKLIEYVIDCHIIPVLPTFQDKVNIEIGYKTFPQMGNPCTSDYIDFDCGTLNISEYYGMFLDYEGTIGKLFLPFIGFVDIDANYFQNALLSVYYRFNIIDGSCIAYVISKKGNLDSVIGVYSGTACVHMPITGENYSSMIGHTVGAVQSASRLQFSNSMNELASGMQGNAQLSNGYNATSSFMGCRYPYIVIERPAQQLPPNYASTVGFPCYVTTKLSNCSGFTKCINPNLNTLNDCDDEELNEIKNLLESGVYM